MSQFKKIVLVIDDKTDINSEKFHNEIIKIVDEDTTVFLTDKLNVKWLFFKDMISDIHNQYKARKNELNTTSKKLYFDTKKDKSIDYLKERNTNQKKFENDIEEIIYKNIEKRFDNNIDDIYDIICSDFKTYSYDDDPKESDNLISWESRKNVPTIFIRDYKQDNKFKNAFNIHFPRIVQFLPDEKLGKKAGEERTNKMLNMGIHRVVIFSNQEENNKFGIEYMAYFSNKMGIKIDYFLDCKKIESEELNTFPKPLVYEKMEIFTKIKINSDIYKRKFQESVKMMRKSYYDSLKDKPTTKDITNEELKETMKTKKKVQTKNSRKKQIKKEKFKKIKGEEVIETFQYE